MILSFEKPKKLRSTDEHNKEHMSDCGVPGTYVPNMSLDDQRKFRAVHIKGEHERIEIRTLIGGVNCNIFVYKDQYQPKYSSGNSEWRKKHRNVQFSMNGKMDVSFEEWSNIQLAINEAIDLLK